MTVAATGCVPRGLIAPWCALPARRMVGTRRALSSGAAMASDAAVFARAPNPTLSLAPTRAVHLTRGMSARPPNPTRGFAPTRTGILIGTALPVRGRRMTTCG